VVVSLSATPLIVGIGFLGATAQYLITEAFRSAPASVIAPFEYTISQSGKCCLTRLPWRAALW
jgi:drug/metabolite transporter (DMT)-like permease